MIRVGTRASALARWQTDEILRLWRLRSPRLEFQVITLSTVGDDQFEAPLEYMEGTGFFTSTIERALLEHHIDVAVHSYKDLPVSTTGRLVVAAVPARGPVEDVLCSLDRSDLAALPPGARIGTSSLRRTAQLRTLRPDLEYMPLRGNVETRLSRLKRGDLAAVVLARAGIERLGLGDRITEVFSIRQMLTAPAQGALAAQVRTDDELLCRELAGIEHEPTRRAVDTERAVLHALRGGCSVPVGAFALVSDERVTLEAGVFAPDGDRPLRVHVVGDAPATTGAEAARQLLQMGASEILAEFDRQPRLETEHGP